MYSRASQRDQGHVTVAGVAGKRQRLTGTCPSTGAAAAAAGRRSATNRRWRAGETPVASPVGHHRQPCAPRVRTESGGGVEPTGQDSRLGHHTTREIYHSLTPEVSLLLPAPYHGSSTILPWTGPGRDDSTETYASPQRDTTGFSRPREGRHRPKNLMSLLLSALIKIQLRPQDLELHTWPGIPSQDLFIAIIQTAQVAPLHRSWQAEAESNLNDSCHSIHGSALLVYTFCSQGWWTLPLHPGVILQRLIMAAKN